MTGFKNDSKVLFGRSHWLDGAVIYCIRLWDELALMGISGV